MITETDKEKAKHLKQYLDKLVMAEETTVNWTLVEWVRLVDKMVYNLEIAPLSYQPLSQEQIDDRYFLAECGGCGWWGCSSLLGGGSPIADTGDYLDVYCPVCESVDIFERDEE